MFARKLERGFDVRCAKINGADDAASCDARLSDDVRRLTNCFLCNYARRASSRFETSQSCAMTSAVLMSIIVSLNHAAASPSLISHTSCFCFAGFAVAAIILEGLVFARVFERDLRAPCVDILQLIAPVAHLLFIFVQMHFLFLNGRVSRCLIYCDVYGDRLPTWVSLN